MLSKYGQEKENVKDEIKGIFSNLVRANELLNTAIKDCDIAKFQEAKTYTMNISNKVNEIDNYIIKILALYSPEARELRRFVAYLKITSELTRVSSNSKSFIAGCIDMKEMINRNILNEYLLPLHTSTLIALNTTKEMMDIDDEDELQDHFNKVVVEEHKTDDLFDLIEEQLLNADMDYKTINKILKTFRKIEKIADRTIEISNLLLYYKIGGKLQNV